MSIRRLVTLGGKNGVKEVKIGGGNPITVQTMWKEGIRDIGEYEIEKIKVQVDKLEGAGCDILRFAVPDAESASSLCKLSRRIDIPLVADIHFDYRLALKSLEGSVAAIRINPGNIGSDDKVKVVVKECAARGVALRIGVNSGSIKRTLQEDVTAGRLTLSHALVLSAMEECNILEQLNFTNYVVSLKASNALDTIKAVEEFDGLSSAPQHIGVTEAGPALIGTVKSTAALLHLLKEGIGDTVRVSLSDTPLAEVIVGDAILKEAGVRERDIEIVSCPRCGREGFDVKGFMARWQDKLLSDRRLKKRKLKIAVMGCVVNGPGEAKSCDIGITGAGQEVILFEKGKVIKKVFVKDADNEISRVLDSLCESL